MLSYEYNVCSIFCIQNRGFCEVAMKGRDLTIWAGLQSRQFFGYFCGVKAETCSCIR